MLLRKPLKLGNVTPGGTVHPEKIVRAGVPGTAPGAGLLWGRLSSATHPAPDTSKSREAELMVLDHNIQEWRQRPEETDRHWWSQRASQLWRERRREVYWAEYFSLFCEVALAHRRWHTDYGVNI